MRHSTVSVRAGREKDLTLPPQNLEAEQAALGAALVDEQARAKVLAVIGDADPWTGSGHREVFQIVRSLHEAGRPVDLVIFRDEAERLGLPGKIGVDSATDLATELATAFCDVANAEHYARIILRLHLERQEMRLLKRKWDAIVDRSDRKTRDAIDAELADLRRRRDVVDGGAGPQDLWTVDQILGDPGESYVVDGIIPDGGSVLLFGPAKAGKSFVCIDLALAVASRLSSWRGHAIRPTPVLYLAMEGGKGLQKRLRAWVESGDAKIDPDMIRFKRRPVPLRCVEDADATIAGLGGFRPGLIFVDTVARAIPGCDENSVKDMGGFVAAVDRLREHFGAAVVAVHHTGKQAENGERGSSCLRAAVDVRIQVKRSGKRGIEVTCEDARDMAEFEPIYLERQTVAVGDSTSCILTSKNEFGGDREISSPARAALDNLHKTSTEDGITYTQWREASELSESTFLRARKELIRAKLVRQVGGGRGARFVPADDVTSITSKSPPSGRLEVPKLTSTTSTTLSPHFSPPLWKKAGLCAISVLSENAYASRRSQPDVRRV